MDGPGKIVHIIGYIYWKYYLLFLNLSFNIYRYFFFFNFFAVIFFFFLKKNHQFYNIAYTFILIAKNKKKKNLINYLYYLYMLQLVITFIIHFYLSFYNKLITIILFV